MHIVVSARFSASGVWDNEMQRDSNGLGRSSQVETPAKRDVRGEGFARENLPGATPMGRIDGLSAFFIAYNEADRIAAAIVAVINLASEIVVVDSGSTDGTQEIAEKLGARVIYNPWKGFGAQKRFGEDQCKGPWLLNLDADEVVASELAFEIRNLFNGGEPDFPAYRLRIAEQFPGERQPHRLAYALAPVRLYRKDAGRYSPSTVHDRVELKKGIRTGLLKERIYHRSIRSLSHQIAKLNSYSDMQVADMEASGRHVPGYRILYEMPLTFLKVYVLRRHFLRGYYGIATAMNIAIARHLRVAKAIEMQHIRRSQEAGTPAPGLAARDAADRRDATGPV